MLVCVAATHCVDAGGLFLMSLCACGAGSACVLFLYFVPMHPAVPIGVPYCSCFVIGDRGFTETFQESKEFSILCLEVVNCFLLLFVDINQLFDHVIFLNCSILQGCLAM